VGCAGKLKEKGRGVSTISKKAYNKGIEKKQPIYLDRQEYSDLSSQGLKSVWPSEESRKKTEGGQASHIPDHLWPQKNGILFFS